MRGKISAETADATTVELLDSFVKAYGEDAMIQRYHYILHHAKCIPDSVGRPAP